MLIYYDQTHIAALHEHLKECEIFCANLLKCSTTLRKSNFITDILCVDLLVFKIRKNNMSINKLLATRHKVSGKFKHITRRTTFKFDIVNIMQPLITLVLHRRVDVV